MRGGGWMSRERKWVGGGGERKFRINTSLGEPAPGKSLTLRARLCSGILGQFRTPPPHQFEWGAFNPRKKGGEFNNPQGQNGVRKTLPWQRRLIQNPPDPPIPPPIPLLMSFARTNILCLLRPSKHPSLSSPRFFLVSFLANFLVSYFFSHFRVHESSHFGFIFIACRPSSFSGQQTTKKTTT